MGWMSLWWIVGLCVLLLMVWAVARSSWPVGPSPDQDSPEAILERRYARGDVDHDEYEHRLSDLRK
jgi:putative membrane protein